MPTAVKWTPKQLALFESGKRPKRARHRPAIERRTHIAVSDMLWKLAKPGWWWSHIPSGEFRTEATGRLLKRMGLKPGLPDFLFISPTGEHHWLELKRDKEGRLNPAQLEFAGMCAERAIPHDIAHSFQEAESRLREWGILR